MEKSFRWIRMLYELDRMNLPSAGGKAANLGVLIRGGLPVPPGFCILTTGYREFVVEGGLQPKIDSICNSIRRPEPECLDPAAARIRSLFLRTGVPESVAKEVRAAYLALDPAGNLPVAVRSSATAEDLPDLSFAGQQDTYLHVIGIDPLMNAVVDCWASLWTARAIGYRMHNGIPREGLALAVAVQRMIPAEASGVLFTANPLTGRRGQAVIDATFGLGEALVSGKVEPDQYVVDRGGGRILSRTLGHKAVQTVSKAGGGIETVASDSAGRQALADGEILDLVRLGERAQALFAEPQDIEWALSGGEFFLVQSRPVTSLFPLPVFTDNPVPADPLQVFLSLAAVQGMLAPITPLGRDIFRMLFASISGWMGGPSGVRQRLLAEAGERLWINITGLFRNAQGRKVLAGIVGAAEPGSREAVDLLLADPRLAMKPLRPSLRTLLHIARAGFNVAGNVAFNLAFPDAGRRRMQRMIDGYLETVGRRTANAHTLEEAASLFDFIASEFPIMLFMQMVPVVAAGAGSHQIILRMAQGFPGGGDLAMEITRSLPNNVTTEMDLALWNAARRVRADPESVRLFQDSDADELARRWQAGGLPEAGQSALEEVLARYGARGVGEIDVGRVRWGEEPGGMIQALKGYLIIPEDGRTPDAVFRGGERNAQEALRRLQELLRATRGGRVKAALAGWLAGRVRRLMGLRESPKFFAARSITLVRTMMLRAGARLAAAGRLGRADDIFLLQVAELVPFAQKPVQDCRALIAQRRARMAAEERRSRIPRILLSDGTAYYEGVGAPADPSRAITGSPVSPGLAEGIVHVVFDPRGVQLAPGEILVCPGTDPAWTPLFLSAGALVMEVGGLMTHGSVVAREYGIPAVVGVHAATTRLKNGQRVRVDGSKGVVEILGDG